MKNPRKLFTLALTLLMMLALTACKSTREPGSFEAKDNGDGTITYTYVTSDGELVTYEYESSSGNLETYEHKSSAGELESYPDEDKN